MCPFGLPLCGLPVWRRAGCLAEARLRCACAAGDIVVTFNVKFPKRVDGSRASALRKRRRRRLSKNTTAAGSEAEYDEALCFTYVDGVLDDEDGRLGSIEFNSVDECESACDNTRDCLSFRLCVTSGTCWLNRQKAKPKPCGL
jgi:hypothetical protein